MRSLVIPAEEEDPAAPRVNPPALTAESLLSLGRGPPGESAGWCDGPSEGETKGLPSVGRRE